MPSLPSNEAAIDRKAGKRPGEGGARRGASASGFGLFGLGAGMKTGARCGAGSGAETHPAIQYGKIRREQYRAKFIATGLEPCSAEISPNATNDSETATGRAAGVFLF